MAEHIPVGVMLDCGKAMAKMQLVPNNTPRAWQAFHEQRTESARTRSAQHDDEQASKRAATLRHVYSEIYNTELLYEAQLEVIDKVVLRPAVALGLKCSSLAQSYVDGIAQLACLHADVVRTMRLEGSKSNDEGGLLMAFHKALPFMKIYKMVIAGYQEAERCLDELTSSSLHYAALLREAQVTPSSFLVRPLQRVYKYHLLFQSMRKYTDPSSSTAPLIEALCDRAHSIATYLDQQQGACDSAIRHRTLYDGLADHFVLASGCTAPLHVLKEHALQVCVHSFHKEPVLRTVTLLSVALVVSVLDKDQYRIEEIVPIASVMVQLCSDDSLELRLLWTQRDDPAEMLLTYESAAMRDDWLQAFRLASAEICAEGQTDVSAPKDRGDGLFLSPRSRRNNSSGSHGLVRFARRTSVELAHKLTSRKDRVLAPLSPRGTATFDPPPVPASTGLSGRRKSLSSVSAELSFRIGLGQHYKNRGNSADKLPSGSRRASTIAGVDDSLASASQSAPVGVQATEVPPSSAKLRARQAARKLRRSRAMSNLDSRSMSALCQSGRT